MVAIKKSKTVSWTHHARAKMNFYRLSEARVRRVLNAPKRTEEGVAPKTVAMMQPASLIFKIKRDAVAAFDFDRGRGQVSAGTPVKSSRTWNDKAPKNESWSQEIWVMVEDSHDRRTIISAWRYPGRTRPKSETALAKMREEYRSFTAQRVDGGDKQ